MIGMIHTAVIQIVVGVDPVGVIQMEIRRAIVQIAAMPDAQQSEYELH